VARDAQSGAPTDRHTPSLERFPFAQWNRTERYLAPPLVIDVRGADVWAAGLAEFLDGHVKLVLVVTGDTSPAPLARLITPGIYVQQATLASELPGLASWDGPGVAALVPETAARFTHNPKAGPSPAERLRVEFLPAAAPRKAIDGISPAQQADELAMLAALAQPAPAPAAPVAAPAAASPADLLAAWLLAQSHAGP
jgi:ribonuclease E